MAAPEINGGSSAGHSRLLSARMEEQTLAGTDARDSLLEGGLLSARSEEERLPRRKGSEACLAPPWPTARRAVAHLRKVFSSKLYPLFPAVPLAVVAESLHFGRAWVFAFSLIGLAPLAERVSFLSEHIADTVGPTAGGLLNATCGNVPELIIALFALHSEKMEILKWSLLGSILSNLLLVLGSSFLFGGLANIGRERSLDRRQADVSIGLLLLGVLCQITIIVSKYTIITGDNVSTSGSVLELSRSNAIVMLIAYFGGLIFQLKTHPQIFEEDSSGDSGSGEGIPDRPIMGFAGAVIWLIGMTLVIAILSNYIVTTIEEASESLGIPVRFISVILLPIVGNAAEHAGAIIFAVKNKIDITLGIALGSASQISMLVVPIVLVVSWVIGIPMDLDLNPLETGSLVMTVLTTTFTLQDEKWHYLKGFNLVLCYVVIAVCFFTMKVIPTPKKGVA